MFRVGDYTQVILGKTSTSPVLCFNQDSHAAYTPMKSIQRLVGLALGAEKRFGIIAVIVGLCMMEMEINWINTVIDTTLVLNDGPIIRRIL